MQTHRISTIHRSIVMFTILGLIALPVMPAAHAGTNSLAQTQIGSFSVSENGSTSQDIIGAGSYSEATVTNDGPDAIRVVVTLGPGDYRTQPKTLYKGQSLSYTAKRDAEGQPIPITQITVEIVPDTNTRNNLNSAGKVQLTR